MIKRGARDVRKGQSHAPRACYDVSMNGFQAKMLNPTAQDLVMGEIMRTAGGDGATKKEAQRRLDAWGLVQAQVLRLTAAGGFSPKNPSYRTQHPKLQKRQFGFPAGPSTTRALTKHVFS